MQIKKLVVAATKGGTGKSTIATNLAACLACGGKDVMLLDADKQATSKRWIERRNEQHPEAPRVHAAQANGDVLQTMNDFARRYDYVICDLGCGEDNSSLRSALCSADVVLIPMRGSINDLDTAGTMNLMLKMFNPAAPAYAVLNMAPTNTHIRHETVSAREFLSEFEQIDSLDIAVSDRKVFRDAMLEGLSVVELRNSQARAEIELLTQFLFNE